MSETPPAENPFAAVTWPESYPDATESADSFSKKLASLEGVRRISEKNKPTCPQCQKPAAVEKTKISCNHCGWFRELPPPAPPASSFHGIELLTGCIHGNRNRCFYCGDFPGELDHVIPFSLFSSKITDGSKPGPKVHACRDCNSRLSDQYFGTMMARCMSIPNALRKRYKKVLRSPEWTDDQIEGLNYTLRVAVIATKTQRILAENRIAWFASREFWRMLDDTHSDVVLRYPNHKWLHEFYAPPSPSDRLAFQ